MNDSYEQVMGSIKSAIERKDIESIYDIMDEKSRLSLLCLGELDDAGIIDLNKDPWKNLPMRSY